MPGSAHRDRELRTSLVIAGREMLLLVRRHPRARRLTLRLPVGLAGVVVTIPERAAFADGVSLARENSSWIAGRIATRPGRVPFADGAIIPLRGGDHEIHHLPRAGPRIRVGAGRILIGGEQGSLARRLDAWLRREARGDLSEQVARLAPNLGLPAGPISVRETRSRWGSCATSGDLSFSWRLVLAPPPVLTYVVAHELAHLIERNHGPRFWALVARIGGDRVADARAWLRRNGPDLHRYG